MPEIIRRTAGSALWIAYTFVMSLVHGREAQPQPVAEIPGDISPRPLTRPLILFAGIRAVAVSIAVAISFGLKLPDADWMAWPGRYPGSKDRVERRNMSLNIKNAETHQLVQELAALTGETQTTAVTVAVRERLDRVRHLREVGLADRLLAIGADTAPRLREPFRSADHGDLLYDQQGLPA